MQASKRETTGARKVPARLVTGSRVADRANILAQSGIEFPVQGEHALGNDTT